MKKLLVLMCFFMVACGQPDTEVVVKDVCGDDSPDFVLPDEVVCNHAPAETIVVEGDTITYTCIQDTNIRN